MPDLIRFRRLAGYFTQPAEQRLYCFINRAENPVVPRHQLATKRRQLSATTASATDLGLDYGLAERRV